MFKKYLFFSLTTFLLISVIGMVIFLCGCNSPTSGGTSSPSSTYTPAKGVLDTSFGVGGIVTSDGAAGGTNSDDRGYGIALDPSGKIVVVGISMNSSYNIDMGLWKYDSYGILDTSFGVNGFVKHNSAAGGNDDDAGVALAIDPSGNIFVAGYSCHGVGIPTGDMTIWKYNSNGTLDTSFGVNGVVTNDSAAGGSGADKGQGIALDPSGKILVTGSSSNEAGNIDMVIWKYNPNGTLDTSFGVNGIVTSDGIAGGTGVDIGYDIALDSSGKILVTGYSQTGSGDDDMVIWRYNSTGTLDTSFNSVGYVTHHNAAGGNGNDDGFSITTDPSGRILVAGDSYNGAGNYDLAIWRYNSNGLLDTSFGVSGIVTHDSAAGGSGADLGKGIAIDPLGKILVAGYSWNGTNQDMALWRYNPDGTLDTSFGVGGIVTNDGAAGGTGGIGNDRGLALAIDSSGNIIVSGYCTNASDNEDMTTWKYK
jgi:uncharacterized delta-60 repeat protein